MKPLYSFLIFFLLSASIHSQTTNFEWAKSSGGSSEDQSRSIITDDAGFIYIVGYFSGIADFDPSGAAFNLTSNGGKDVFIQKLDPNSNFMWAKSFGGIGDDICNSVDITSSGDILLTGQYEGTVDFDPSGATAYSIANGGSDIFIQKLDSNGDFVWVRSFGNSDDDKGTSVAVDESNNVFVTGSFAGIVDFDPNGTGYSLTSNGDEDVFIQKMDMNGLFVWCKSFGGLARDFSTSLDLDNLGNIYIAGGFFSDSVDFDPGIGSSYHACNGIVDIFVQKIDQTGNFNWAVTMGSWNVDLAADVVCDTLGNVYTTGYFYSTVDFDPSAGVANLISNGNVDGYIQKLDSSGNYIWAKSFGGNDSEYAASISLDNWGGIYVTGSFEGIADFDPSGTSSTLTSNGMSDVFIEKLDANGDFVWAKSFGSFSSDEGQAITVDNLGNVYTTGSFRNTVDFDPGTNVFDLSSNGIDDIFVQKLNQPIADVNEIDYFSNVLVYPNPNQGLISVDLGNLTEVTIKIYDTYGRLEYVRRNVKSPYHQLELNGAKGAYILEVESLGEIRRYQIIKQ